MNLAEKIKDGFERSKQFYLDVRSEMRKVSWPSRQEVLGTTIVVIVATFFFGLYLGAADYVLGAGITWLFKYFTLTGTG